MRHEIVAYCNVGWLGKMTEEDLKILTGVNIAFGKCNPDASAKVDHIYDIDAVARMKEINPEIRVMISMGGACEPGWSNASYTKAGRERLVSTTIEFVRKWNLDGVDLDWEFPTRSELGIDARPEDKYTFSMLVEEFRRQLDLYEEEDKKHYYLTMASAGDMFMFDVIDVPHVASIMDYISLMTYDLREQNDLFMRGNKHDILSGYHTNLYPMKGDPFGISIERCVELFRVNGVPSEKIIIGSAFYNKRWEGLTPENNGRLQIPNNGTGEEYGPEKGVGPSYKTLKENYIDKNGFVRYWDDDAKTPYLFNAEKGILVSYDDEQSIKEKCKYCKEQGLLGIMYWEYHEDPTFTLTKAHYDGFYGEE